MKPGKDGSRQVAGKKKKSLVQKKKKKKKKNKGCRFQGGNAGGGRVERNTSLRVQKNSIVIEDLLFDPASQENRKR